MTAGEQEKFIFKKNHNEESNRCIVVDCQKKIWKFALMYVCKTNQEKNGLYFIIQGKKVD